MGAGSAKLRSCGTSGSSGPASAGGARRLGFGAKTAIASEQVADVEGESSSL